MLVTQSVCCDVFDGDVWLDKYCAKIFAIGIFLRILTGIDNPRRQPVHSAIRRVSNCEQALGLEHPFTGQLSYLILV
jgi:hypothetical protein